MIGRTGISAHNRFLKAKMTNNDFVDFIVVNKEDISFDLKALAYKHFKDNPILLESSILNDAEKWLLKQGEVTY